MNTIKLNTFQVKHPDHSAEHAELALKAGEIMRNYVGNEAEGYKAVMALCTTPEEKEVGAYTCGIIAGARETMYNLRGLK